MVLPHSSRELIFFPVRQTILEYRRYICKEYSKLFLHKAGWMRFLNGDDKENDHEKDMEISHFRTILDPAY